MRERFALARIKKNGKNFEVVVNLDEALKFKKGELKGVEARIDRIWNDAEKALVASDSDLVKSFGTYEPQFIVEKIVKDGKILK